MADPDESARTARSHFLRDDHFYGCAETAFITLKEAYGLSEPLDSSAAMALNGGIAYSGGMCGALTGATLAVGMLAEQRISDHKLAKRVARRLVAQVMERFRASLGAVNCRDLIGLDIREEDQHRQFLDSGIWRTRCMQGIEFSVRELSALADEGIWRWALGEAAE